MVKSYKFICGIIVLALAISLAAIVMPWQTSAQAQPVLEWDQTFDDIESRGEGGGAVLPFKARTAGNHLPQLSSSYVDAAKTIYVDDDFTDDPANHQWNTIQEGIDDAGDGDTIIVHEGTYDGFTVGNKNDLSIAGQDGVTVNSANMVIEDGQEFGLMASIAKSTGIRIEDIVFDGGEIHVGMLVGIYYDDSTGSITDVTVRNIIGSELAMGIAISGSEEVPSAVDISHLTVENCILGIMVSNAETNLDRCSIKGMAPYDGHGIMAIDNAQVTMEKCVIYDCWNEAPQPGQAGFGIMVGMPKAPPPPPEAAYGIEDERPSTVEMTGCTISNNNFGIYVADDGDLVANGNNIEGNDICGVYKENPPSVDATNNWWGDASGPSGAGPGTGDAVTDNVDYDPWLLEPAGPTVTWNLRWGLDADPAAVNIWLYPEDAVQVTLAGVEWSMPDGLLIWHYGGPIDGWRFYKKGWGASNTLATLVPGDGYIGIVPTASIWEIPQG